MEAGWCEKKKEGEKEKGEGQGEVGERWKEKHSKQRAELKSSTTIYRLQKLLEIARGRKGDHSVPEQSMFSTWMYNLICNHPVSLSINRTWERSLLLPRLTY